jgi:hypothetical protein
LGQFACDLNQFCRHLRHLERHPDRSVQGGGHLGTVEPFPPGSYVRRVDDWIGLRQRCRPDLEVLSSLGRADRLTVGEAPAHGRQRPGERSDNSGHSATARRGCTGANIVEQLSDR